MNPLDFPISDADNHYHEPDDCFTRHIEGLPAGDVRRIMRDNLAGLVA